MENNVPEKVVTYKFKDGTVCQTERAAIRYQSYLDFLYWYNTYCPPEINSAEDLYDIVEENLDTFEKLIASIKLQDSKIKYYEK